MDLVQACNDTVEVEVKLEAAPVAAVVAADATAEVVVVAVVPVPVAAAVAADAVEPDWGEAAVGVLPTDGRLSKPSSYCLTTCSDGI